MRYLINCTKRDRVHNVWLHLNIFRISFIFDIDASVHNDLWNGFHLYLYNSIRSPTNTTQEFNHPYEYHVLAPICVDHGQPQCL